MADVLGTVLSLFVAVVYAAEAVISPIPLSPDALNMTATSSSPISIFSLTPRGGRQPEPEDLIAPPLVLGVQDETNETTTPSPTPELTPTPTPIQATSSKKNVTVAVLGDSMVDTLGIDLPEMRAMLDSYYPGTKFTMLNYGVGATNIEYGLVRILNGYTYLDREIPSLESQKPDIVVIESFGYNPFPYDEGALERHWLAMAYIVDTIQQHLPDAEIVIAVTIAPNWDLFGDGAPGVAFGPQDKIERSAVIRAYLESTIKFAKSQGLPLADAYTPSKLANGNGNPAYINAGDHIHPSPAGRKLFADVVAQTIATNDLLK